MNEGNIMEHNCAFQDGKYKFRYRAAAVIICNNRILMVTANNVDYYYSIGGAVHLGERAEDAVVREVYEEAGIHCEIERLLFIHENFFAENGFDNHEIAFYFLIKPINLKSIKMTSNSCGFQEYLKWIPLNDLPNLKTYPVFFKDELATLPTIPKHLITK